MILIGIDFSINSPGICIKDNNTYRFISAYNDNGRDPNKPTLKAFKWHEELSSTNCIELRSYDRLVKTKDFQSREIEKFHDSEMIANVILDVVKEYPADDIYIGIEGFSYGSAGNSFIDLIQYNTRLRIELIKYINNTDRFFIFQPSHVKKTAGKGNCGKPYMFESFKENKINDDLITGNPLWNRLKLEDFNEVIPKPIDDLIDSYFIVKSIEQKLALNDKK